MCVVNLKERRKKFYTEEEGEYLRIIALRDIPVAGVKKGDYGGLLDDEKCLSHNGDCWVSKGSRATAGSTISGDVLIEDCTIFKNSVVNASGIIRRSLIGGSKIFGDIEMFDVNINGDTTIETEKHLKIVNSSFCDSFLKSSGLIENLTMTSSILEAWGISIAKHKTADMINSVVISDGFMKFRGFFMENAKLDIKGGLTFRYPMSICDAIVRDGESICCFSDLTFYRDAETNEIKVSTLHFIELDDPNEDASLKFESEMKDDISDWKATAYLLDGKYAAAAKKMIANYIGMNFTENKSNEKI